MRALKVVREAGVRWVVAQGGLEPVSRRPPLRDEPTNRYPVTRDDDGLTMLDCIEDVGEAPCRLRSSYRDHEYTLSDLVCLCVYERRGPLPAMTGSWTAGSVAEVAPGQRLRYVLPERLHAHLRRRALPRLPGARGLGSAAVKGHPSERKYTPRLHRDAAARLPGGQR
jgi:hypothetical protein